ncbi:MAG TPA: ferritin-like domain-containing protein [Solirubrobacteraceae bacterium]|nr:ferritin-like domain-containing protein [Solirubrobacteraceae bacterium]
MSEHTQVQAEDIQRLENVLTDTVPAVTRRDLIGKAALGAAGIGVLGALGPIPAALASPSGGIGALVDAAVTAEALAVTYLTGLVENASKIGIPANLVPVLKAANAAEYDHYRTLRSLGAKPLTTKFWAPNSFFASSKDVFATIEYAETQFVNAYLIAITTFAKAGKTSLARYAGEILGTEAEHRALARFAQGKLPNNVGFESYRIHSIGGIVAALEHAGVGFGKKGKGAGAFYEFKRPPASALTAIESNKPA